MNETKSVDSGISLLTDDERAKRLSPKEPLTLQQKQFHLGVIAQSIRSVRNIQTCPWGCYGRGHLGTNEKGDPIICPCVVDAMARTGGMKKVAEESPDSGQGDVSTPENGSEVQDGRNASKIPEL